MIGEFLDYYNILLVIQYLNNVSKITTFEIYMD